MIRLFNKKSKVFLFLGILVSCAPAGRISVRNVNDSGFSQPSSMIYSLPQTVIDVTVRAEEIEIIPGPYQQYAAKYLGIRGVSSKKEHFWNITGVNISSHLETDPDYVYSVHGTFHPEVYPQITALMNDSLILGNEIVSGTVYNYTFPIKKNILPFTYNSDLRDIEIQNNAEIRLAMPDTNYSKKPGGKNVLKEKTTEQMAEQAANFLVKLKKRRAKLVTAQFTYMPQGIALSDALKEISRLESEYLSYFIGKRILRNHVRTYHYTPVSGNDTKGIVLLRFGEMEGYLDARESAGNPVLIEIVNGNKNKGLEQSRLPSKSLENTIYYRLPDLASVRLMVGESVVAEAGIPMFQSGVIIALNVSARRE
jgi:hypothetical protein